MYSCKNKSTEEHTIKTVSCISFDGLKGSHAFLLKGFSICFH